MQEKLQKDNSITSFNKDTHVLSELLLESFIEKDFVSVRYHSTLRTLVDAVAHSKRSIFPVTDDEGKLVGVILLDDIRELMFNVTLYDSVLVNQLMQKPLVTINVNDDMGVVMEKFDKSAAWNIPVLDDAKKYTGFISKSSIFSNYRDKLKHD